jgi:hypothetical protein
MLSMPVITTEVGRLRAYWRHSSGVTVLLARICESPIDFIPNTAICLETRTGTTFFSKLRKCGTSCSSAGPFQNVGEIRKQRDSRAGPPIRMGSQHSSSVGNLSSGHRMQQSVQACMGRGVLTLAKNGISEIFQAAAPRFGSIAQRSQKQL